jgi:RNA polymerase sigma factor (TIGR02999 family)
MALPTSSHSGDQRQADSPTTLLLRAAAGGNREAAADLLPVLYAELKRLAGSWMAHQPREHTLQPTALVHEAYARLIGSGDPGWDGRRQFFFAAARAMQDILVEHARRKGAQKRGGDRQRVETPDLELAVRLAPDDMLALDTALSTLKTTNERMHQIVMLRFFAGLTVQETALALEVDASTVARDWRVARAWLFGQLNADGAARDA